MLSKRVNKDFPVSKEGTWTPSFTDTPQLYIGAQRRTERVLLRSLLVIRQGHAAIWFSE